MVLVCFCTLWKHLETSSFLMYFREYRNRPVPLNRLKMFLTNMSAECWYSCLFHSNACFLIIICTCTGSFNALKRCKVSMFSHLSCFPRATSSDCFFKMLMATSWNKKLFLLRQSAETINFFYYGICFKLIETNGLMYSLKESSLKMLFK